MTRLRKTLALTLAVPAAVAAVAFAQAKAKEEAAAPVVGKTAPAYTLPDQNGVTHTSVRDKGKVTLLAFYPADFTGGCTQEAHSLTSAYPALKAEGVTVYGVSVQDPKSHKGFCSKEGIPYDLLADTEKKMATAYGVLIPGVGIADRVTFILGADGKVADVDRDVNGHLATCGADWAAWVKAHPAVTRRASADAVQGSGGGVETTGTPLSAAPFHRVHIKGSEFRPVAASFATHPAGPAVIGKAAPAFSLPNVETNTQIALNPQALTKKATVVMFVSTRCPYSNAYNGRMTALANKYRPLGVAFVAVNANKNEPLAECAAYQKAQAFPFPTLKDADDRVADAYGAHVTPETYLIDSRGVLVYHGRIDNSMDPAEVKTHDLANALDATLAGRAVVKAETKAFGCGIKR